jgi:hypothetical protein
MSEQTVLNVAIATRGVDGAALAEARHHGRIGRDAASEFSQGHAARGRLTAAKAAAALAGGLATRPRPQTTIPISIPGHLRVASLAAGCAGTPICGAFSKLI